jgi:hypothetical protein
MSLRKKMIEKEAMGTLEFGRFFCTSDRSVGAGFWLESLVGTLK